MVCKTCDAALLIPISYVTLFIGTITAIMFSNQTENTSISDCVAGWDFSGVLFKCIIVSNGPILTILLYKFMMYLQQWEESCDGDQLARRCSKVYWISLVQFCIGILGLVCLCLLAFFPVHDSEGSKDNLSHDVHMISAGSFFFLMYLHLLISVILQCACGAGCHIQSWGQNSGWYVLRLFSACTGALVLFGAFWGLELTETHSWTFPHFEWLYLATFSTYVFTFWRELVEKKATSVSTGERPKSQQLFELWKRDYKLVAPHTGN